MSGYAGEPRSLYAIDLRLTMLESKGYEWAVHHEDGQRIATIRTPDGRVVTVRMWRLDDALQRAIELVTS